jgi:hypothetical protein
LWWEIAAPGDPRGYRTAARLVAPFRVRERAGSPVLFPPPGLTPRQAVGLLARPERQAAHEQESVALLSGLHSEIATTIALLDRFAALSWATRDQEQAAERLHG